MEYKRLTSRGYGGDANVIHEGCVHYWQGCPMCDFDDAMGECYPRILNRLAELEDKIEQGTLIELPCKVGDTVYFAYPNDDNDGMIIDKGKVDGISHQKDGIWVYARYKSGLTYWHKQEEIGERLFLTREEAEKKLKELKK